MILVFISLFSVTASAGIFSKKCPESFSKYGQELSSQLKSGDLVQQKNALDLLQNYGADNKLIRKSLRYVLRSSPSEDIRLQVIQVLQAHHKNPDLSIFSIVRIGNTLRKHLKKESSEKIRLALMDYLSTFVYSDLIKNDLLKIAKQEVSPFREKALEKLEYILDFHLIEWNNTLTSLKNSVNQKVVNINRPAKINQESSKEVIERAEYKAAFYSKHHSQEIKILKPVLKILKPPLAEVNLEPVALARGLSMLPQLYSRDVREKAFDLLERIYHINRLKIEIIDILKDNIPFSKREEFEWNPIYKEESMVERMNKKIIKFLLYLVKHEPAINTVLIRKSFDLLMKIFKKGAGNIHKDAMFGFLQDMSRDESRPPLIRQRAANTLEDF